MNWQPKFSVAYSYPDFLTKYGQPTHLERWHAVWEKVRLTGAQRELLGSFTRQMNVLCLAGTWCGDCMNQCPIFEQFASAHPTIQLRFLDRDEHPDVQCELSINGGHRVAIRTKLSGRCCRAWLTCLSVTGSSLASDRPSWT